MQTLLKLLQDGRFHSGEELGRYWASVAVQSGNACSTWRLNMACSSTRCVAYRLASPLSLLDRGRSTASGLSRSCPPSIRPIARPCAGSRLEPRRLSLSSPSSSCRAWTSRPSLVSPYGENLYYSLAITVRGARELEGLSLVVGLAVLRALESLGVRDAGLKWPNDLLQGGKKIAGILLELSGDPRICVMSLSA